MSILRPLGWMLLLIGVVLLVHDLMPALQHHGAFRPVSLDGFIERSGIVGALVTLVLRIWQALMTYVVHPAAGLIGMVWAFAVFLVMGAALITLSGGWRRRR